MVKLNNIKYFALNVADLTLLNEQEKFFFNILIGDKMKPTTVIIDTNRIGDEKVLLYSSLTLNPRITPNQQVLATCKILKDRFNIKTYYSKNGKTFHTFNPYKVNE